MADERLSFAQCDWEIPGSIFHYICHVTAHFSPHMSTNQSQCMAAFPFPALQQPKESTERDTEKKRKGKGAGEE